MANEFIIRKGFISKSNSIISGSLTITGNISGTIDSASYVDYTDIDNLPTLVSGSSQVNYPNLSNIPGGIVSGSSQLDTVFLEINGDNVVSGSSQIDVNDTQNFTPFSSSVDSRIDVLEITSESLDSTYEEKASTSHTLISGSSQLDTVFLEINGDNVVSGSSQIDVNDTQNFTPFSSSVDSRLDLQESFSSSLDASYEEKSSTSHTLISGSSQVNYPNLSNIPGGIVSGSSQLDTVFLEINGDNVVSGSSQIDVNDTQNFTPFSSSVDSRLFNQETFTSSIQTEVDAISAETSSYLKNTSDTLDGDLIVTGNITAQEFHTEFVSASIIYESGSTKFGDTLDDTHQFTGSVDISGSLSITDNSLVTNLNADLLDSQQGSYYLNYGNFTSTPSINDATITISAGTGLSTGGSFTTNQGANDTITLNLDINSLNVGGSLLGTDHIAVSNATDTEKQLISAIPLSIFNNDSGWSSTVGTVTSIGITAGNLIDISGSPITTNGNITVNVDLTELSTSTDNANGDYFVVTDLTGPAQYKLAKGNIALSGFNNDSGFISSYTETDTLQDVTGRGASSNVAITISNATASTTKTTGALIVTGGIGTSGDINAGGDITAFATSDRRLKKNITPITNPIEKIKKLSGNTFDWNEELQDLHKGSDVGIVAQELEEVLPDLVTTRDNGYKAVKYDKIVALLIETTKAQQKQIEELQTRVEFLLDNKL